VTHVSRLSLLLGTAKGCCILGSEFSCVTTTIFGQPSSKSRPPALRNPSSTAHATLHRRYTRGECIAHWTKQLDRVRKEASLAPDAKIIAAYDIGCRGEAHIKKRPELARTLLTRTQHPQLHDCQSSQSLAPLRINAVAFIPVCGNEGYKGLSWALSATQPAKAHHGHALSQHTHTYMHSHNTRTLTHEVEQIV
jgi:hypothetical protein